MFVAFGRVSLPVISLTINFSSALLQISDDVSDYHSSVGSQQPTLSLLGSLLNSVITALERVAEEKSLLINRVNLIKFFPPLNLQYYTSNDK